MLISACHPASAAAEQKQSGTIGVSGVTSSRPAVKNLVPRIYSTWPAGTLALTANSPYKSAGAPYGWGFSICCDKELEQTDAPASSLSNLRQRRR